MENILIHPSYVVSSGKSVHTYMLVILTVTATSLFIDQSSDKDVKHINYVKMFENEIILNVSKLILRLGLNDKQANIQPITKR